MVIPEYNLYLLFRTNATVNNTVVKYDGINRLHLRTTNKITKIIVHPNFVIKTSKMDFDYAILHLKDAVIESSNVKIIKVADKNPPVLTRGLLTGWGLDQFIYSDEILNGSIMLKYAELTVMSRERCTDMRQGDRRYHPITPRFICARYPTVSACSVF